MRDGSRLVSLLVRALRTALTDRPPEPSLALLGGPATVRVGSPAVYLVRVCNPTSRATRLRLVADGVCTSPRASRFHTEQLVDVRAAATADYRLSTSWDGRATLATALEGVDLAGDARPDPREPHCEVHVRLVDRGTTLDHLAVRSAIVA